MLYFVHDNILLANQSYEIHFVSKPINIVIDCMARSGGSVKCLLFVFSLLVLLCPTSSLQNVIMGSIKHYYCRSHLPISPFVPRPP